MSDEGSKSGNPRKRATGARKRQNVKGSVPAMGAALRKENGKEHTEIARALVLAAWRGILQGLIKKAKDGGYQQTKLLLDLCEITSGDGTQVNEQRRQLCDALLEGLGLSPAAQGQAAEPEWSEKTEDS